MPCYSEDKPSKRGNRLPLEQLIPEPFAKPLTEREWLRGVSRMWDLIRRSATVADYNRALQKLHLFT